MGGREREKMFNLIYIYIYLIIYFLKLHFLSFIHLIFLNYQHLLLMDLKYKYLKGNLGLARLFPSSQDLWMLPGSLIRCDSSMGTLRCYLSFTHFQICSNY